MTILVIQGKLYAFLEEEPYDFCDFEEAADELTHRYYRDLIRFAEYVIDCDYDATLSWRLTKNRYSGEEFEFFSFDDAFEYIQSVGEGIQRHKGIKRFKSDKEVFSFLKSLSPIWAEGKSGSV